MDTMVAYQAAVERVLARHAAPPSHGHIQPVIVRDAKQGDYLLMHIGWNNGQRVHGVVIHLRVCADKVYIEYDGTMAEPSLADQLVRAGIPRSAIVLAFWQPAESGEPIST